MAYDQAELSLRCCDLAKCAFLPQDWGVSREREELFLGSEGTIPQLRCL